MAITLIGWFEIEAFAISNPTIKRDGFYKPFRGA